ncbi:eCIS core domain-containing protein [Hyalangium versicolor]|uniref:eCIS core domain-containing protein n=1 Tax=Hyalangium versicolor TaxID=2861190 RepID=UPI001CC99D0F|nr:DUF4157 domain-containing protein [Hyalangium versicolor]
MSAFARKLPPSRMHPAAPKSAPRHSGPAPAVNPSWSRLATSSTVGAALSPEVAGERRRYFEPYLPSISSPGDASEREADAVADKVMQRQGGSEEGVVQRKAQGSVAPVVSSPLVHDALNSPGQPLDPGTRSFMEERFNQDFSHVRVHSDARAAASARAVNALAYTVGRDIVFGSGQFAPSKETGQRLLAHELVHTLQPGPARLQRAAGSGATEPVDPDTLGPLFIKTKAELEKQGLPALKVKPSVAGVPYVLFSPHSEAGKVPLRGLLEGGDAFLIRSGQIYRQVWAQQEGKPADRFYWGWVNPSLLEAKAKPPAETTAPAAPAKPEPAPEGPPPLTAEPNVKCPDNQDDTAALKCFTESVREQVRHSIEGDIYQARLKKGVELLQSAGFGRLEGSPRQFEPGGPLDWEGETYNKDYWKAEDHPKFLRKLVLKPDKQPSAAIDDMFSHLGEWKVDCGQFVQVANLYALRHALGTQGFNQLNKNEVAFELKPHASTGVRRVKFYERFRPDAPMVRHPEKEPETKSIDELLREAPVGSRVMWTNLQAPLSSAYHNENTLKLGDDQFAAHGFMADLKKNVFTRKELEFALAKLTQNPPDDAYIKANVFVAEIEHYQSPRNPTP